MRFYPGSYTDLQETAARIPALSRLLRANGILTASGLISKTAVNRQRVRKRMGGGIGGVGGTVPHTHLLPTNPYVHHQRG